MKLVSLALCAEAAWAYKLSFEFGDEQSNATSPRLLPLDGFYPDSWDCEHVQPVPSKVRRTYKLDDFYQKYTHAYGIPILSSDQVRDSALRRACYTVRFMRVRPKPPTI